MKIEVYRCENDDDFRVLPEVAILIKRHISMDDEYYGEVEYHNIFHIKKWSDKGCNVYFRRLDDKEEYTSYFYVKANWYLKFRFNLMFKRYWVQKDANWKWLIGIVGGYMLGKYL